MLITAIIPAHNEAAVIAESLRSLRLGGSDGDIEIIVVCNGCTDDTAAVAAREPGVRVIESPVPSKVAAINMGLQHASAEHVVVVDADIRLSGDGLGGLAKALSSPGVLAAAPRAEMDFAPDTEWAVRAYYKVWFSLPYVREGMMGCGVYAVGAAGRGRVFPLPDIIADDGFVRGSFAPSERVRVDAVTATVRAPRRLADLVKIKTRSRLGGYQLAQRFQGKLPGQNERSQHGSAWRGMLLRPYLWASIVAYLYVNLVSRRRAKAQLARMETYVWERDESARVSPVMKRAET
jgi:glycosyltransferase involved in cell wall biosynthesis